MALVVSLITIILFSLFHPFPVVILFRSDLLSKIYKYLNFNDILLKPKVLRLSASYFHSPLSFISLCLRPALLLYSTCCLPLPSITTFSFARILLRPPDRAFQKWIVKIWQCHWASSNHLWPHYKMCYRELSLSTLPYLHSSIAISWYHFFCMNRLQFQFRLTFCSLLLLTWPFRSFYLVQFEFHYFFSSLTRILISPYSW